MLKRIMFLCIVLLNARIWATEPVSLKTQNEKESYAIGVQIGKNLYDNDIEVDSAMFLKGLRDALAGSLIPSANQRIPSYEAGTKIGSNFKTYEIEIDSDIFLQGVKDALDSSKFLLNDDEMSSILSAYRKELQQKIDAKAKIVGETNRRASELFLAGNMKRKEVVTLPSGLQYRILKAGVGKKPTVNDTVVCNYKGSLIDGTEFDSSYKRGMPETFAVSEVIKGWTEALLLMPVGSKWQLFVPATLAYGEDGAGREVGPNAALIFEVELLSIRGPEDDAE
jgi:FKBP-type peptidyl-prolyl cis-trans isomerase